MVNLASLNPRQREAVETLKGPVLILAGAGTGKTRVITHRIAHLIDRGAAPGHILAVTFTNKAAREMQSRIASLLGPRRAGGEGDPAMQRPTICTFHSLCVRILRRHAERLGYRRDFVIYDESEQLGVIKKILSRISDRAGKADAAAVLGWLGRYRNAGPGGRLPEDPVADLAGHIAQRYESALRACNAMDFDDLILLTLRLFREHSGALDECRERYRHVMVDEYQDTNAAQFELVHALTRRHRNLCVVGDDDQSIYGWRGAEIANLLDMEKHFPEVKVVKLEQNYRSTRTILSLANALIRNNARRREKQLWSSHGEGARVRLCAYENEETEAREVVAAIQYARRIENVPWSTQAVLFRTNIQSRPLETALRQAGVRYHLVGGQSFFDRREIRDFLAYLKVLLNPSDDISLLRIANVPARGLSDATMERLMAQSHEDGTSIHEAMKRAGKGGGLSERTRRSLGEFVGQLEAWRGALNQARGPALRSWAARVLEESGYLQDLRRSERDPEAGENRVRNLLDLAATLDGVDPAGEPGERLRTFLEEISLDSDRGKEEEGEGDAVTLITMHSCKGLEFPHVHIVGLEEGLLPHTRSKEEGTLDEERRLFYVAITRAMKTLTLSHCGARRKYGQLVPCHPSRFLNELPAELLDDADQKPVSAEDGRAFFASLKASLGGR